MIRAMSWLLAGVFVANVACAQSAELPASAEQMALARQLSVELRMPELLDSVRKDTNASVRGQVDASLAQLAKAGMPEDLMSQMRASFSGLLDKVNASWNSEEAARIYTTGLVKDMSTQDLHDALDFYATDSGQASYLASLKAAKEMNQYILSTTSKVLNEQMAIVLPEIIAKARAAAKARAEAAH